MRRLAVALALWAAGAAAQPTGTPAAPAPEGPFFVFTGSFSTKAAAQAHARAHGGWVLGTNLFSGLPPGYFAVVHGPFDERPDAEAALARIRPAQPEAYVRQAGYPYLLPELGDPGLLAALLGALEVRDVGRSSCGPAEAHHTLIVIASATGAEVARFWLIERTGEVRPARACER